MFSYYLTFISGEVICTDFRSLLFLVASELLINKSISPKMDFISDSRFLSVIILMFAEWAIFDWDTFSLFFLQDEYSIAAAIDKGSFPINA